MTTLVKELGDRLSQLTLREAVNLSRYLEEVHQIEVPTPSIIDSFDDPDVSTTIVQSEFAVKLTAFTGSKIAMIKSLRAQSDLDLMGAKHAIENLPYTVAEDVSREQAERLQGQLEDGGGIVELV